MARGGCKKRQAESDRIKTEDGLNSFPQAHQSSQSDYSHCQPDANERKQPTSMNWALANGCLANFWELSQGGLVVSMRGSHGVPFV